VQLLADRNLMLEQRQMQSPVLRMEKSMIESGGQIAVEQFCRKDVRILLKNKVNMTNHTSGCATRT